VDSFRKNITTQSGFNPPFVRGWGLIRREKAEGTLTNEGVNQEKRGAFEREKGYNLQKPD